MRHLLPLLLLFLVSCNHITTTKTLKTERYSFEHAKNKYQLSIQLREQRNSDRVSDRLFDREITFEYTLAVEWNEKGQDVLLLEIPWKKEQKLEEFTKEIAIKRSKNRRHFALAYGNNVFAIGNVFVGQAFIRNSSLDSDFKDIESKLETLQLDKLPAVRTDLRAHLTGEKKLAHLSGQEFAAILMKLPPQDELNQELIYALAEDRDLGIYSKTLSELIAKLSESTNWKKKAFTEVKKYRNLDNPTDWVNKLALLGGKKALDEEDWIQVNQIKKTHDITYFSIRIQKEDFPLNTQVKKQLIEAVKMTLRNPCINQKGQKISMLMQIRFLEKLSNQAAFDDFLTAYEKSNCIPQTISNLHSEFLFLDGKISAHEKRRWLHVVLKHFPSIPAQDRADIYADLEKSMTCQQKKRILEKYRKDIDPENEKVLPVCE